jgi:DNA-binding GntR family transcriptional regulator
MVEIFGEGGAAVGQAAGFSQHRQKLSRSVFSGPIASLLRERIISGALQPGAKLAESALADELGVSRGPVRNALQALESEGLVRTQQNGRVIVVGFAEADLEDLTHTRFVLESAAAEMAIARNADLDPLEEALAAMQEEGASTPRLVDLDIAFHVALLDVSGSRFISHAWKACASVIHAGMTITNGMLSKQDAKQAFGRIIEKHQKILEGLEARDLDRVIEALHEHFGLTESVFTQAKR